MKSTKIEDILETVDEDVTDDSVQEDINNIQNDVQVNNELKKQLENLQNELSNMKQTDNEVKHISEPVTIKVARDDTKNENSEKDLSLFDKLVTMLKAHWS